VSHQVDAITRGEVEALLVEWAWLIDHGRAVQAAALYAEDSIQQVGGVRTEGQDSIRKNLERRAAMTARTSRHLVSNVRLTRKPAETIEANWILTLFRSDDANKPARPLMICDVQDHLFVHDGAWKIGSRTISTIFEG
jgi:3-phenylpropionate/cinnamic acid dioxygenase small subunit